MGEIGKKIREKDIGTTGIGAMIVFIAIVLVAGIAASVLIQTSLKLETQAMSTGQQTIGEVATGVAVTGIEGYNFTDQGKIYWMAIGVRARAGSQDIDLGKAVIEISDSGTKNFLTYDSGCFTDESTLATAGNIFKGGNASTSFYPDNATQFGIIVLEDADSSVDSSTPVINKGDHVLLTVNVSQCFEGIDERTDVFGMVIPEHGSPGMISFTAPAAINVKVIELQ